MIAGVMQPYFMAYIGYFQLISAVDVFIVYDNIKYTKKGWINRNRILRNDEAVMISLPLKSGSDALNVVERQLADSFEPRKILGQLEGSYRAAPYFRQVYPLVEEIMLFDDRNLFRFNLNSIESTCRYLSISTSIRVSSSFDVDHDLKSKDKVLALCEAVGADIYVNPIGGLSLYSKSEFLERGVQLRFLRSDPFEYAQFGAQFVPWLSIIDVMMFNERATIEGQLRSGWKCE